MDPVEDKGGPARHAPRGDLSRLVDPCIQSQQGGKLGRPNSARPLGLEYGDALKQAKRRLLDQPKIIYTMNIIAVHDAAWGAGKVPSQRGWHRAGPTSLRWYFSGTPCGVMDGNDVHCEN